MMSSKLLHRADVAKELRILVYPQDARKTQVMGSFSVIFSVYFFGGGDRIND